MPRLEPRLEPSRAMMLASPLLAALAMLATGSLLFLFLGQAVPRALARTRPVTAASLLLALARFLTNLVRPLSAVADGAADLLTRLGARRNTRHSI